MRLLLLFSSASPGPGARLQAGSAGCCAWIAVTAIGVTYAVRQLCAWARLRWMAILGEHVARDLRNELYEHLQKLSMSFFSRKKRRIRAGVAL